MDSQQGKDQGAYKETFVIAHVALVQNGHQQRRQNAAEGGAQAGGGNKGSTLTFQRGNHRGQAPERHILHGKGHAPQNVGDQRPHKSGGGILLKGRSKQQYGANGNGHRCKQQIGPHFAPLGLGAIYDHTHHRVIESVKDTANQDDGGALRQGQPGAVLEEYQGKHGHQRVNTGAAEGTHGKAYPLPGSFIIFSSLSGRGESQVRLLRHFSFHAAADISSPGAHGCNGDHGSGCSAQWDPSLNHKDNPQSIHRHCTSDSR